MGALFAWEIAMLVVLTVAPEVLPPRWHLYIYPPLSGGPDHRYLYTRASILLLFEGLALWYAYRHGSLKARVAAGLVGAGILLAVLVELVLITVRVPSNTLDLIVLAWIGVGHVVYALFWRGRRA